MHIGVATIQIRISESHSLKAKRYVLKSIMARVKNKFNVSVAEVDGNDLWQLATIGVACVSNDGRHANEMLSKVVGFVEDNLRGDAEVIDCGTEIISV